MGTSRKEMHRQFSYMNMTEDCKCRLPLKQVSQLEV